MYIYKKIKHYIEPKTIIKQMIFSSNVAIFHSKKKMRINRRKTNHDRSRSSVRNLMGHKFPGNEFIAGSLVQCSQKDEQQQKRKQKLLKLF